MTGSGGRQNNKPSTPIMVHQHTAACNEKQQPDKEKVLFPAKISKKGNYGYEVKWADGTIVIYSLLAIATSAGGKPHHPN